MAKTAPPEVGTLIVGKYRVERAIGSGGMGVVVEATHLALDQRVAIKLLNPELAASPEIFTRFIREARIAAMLPSEHIARVSDVGQTETGAPYLVMELLTGNDLEAELARRGKLPIVEAVDLILQACEGLADAHAAGLVHRDLKPANLFLARRPNRTPILKVLDFGLSKETGSEKKALTATGSVFGTPQYMSPEQIQSTKNVDAHCDQHALGMILYELITGATAYSGVTITDLIVAIATKPPPSTRALRAEVPARLDAAITRAMAKRAGDRFAELGGFAKAIEPFGGPLAPERVQNIKAALLVKAQAVTPGATPRSPRALSDEQITAPIGVIFGKPQGSESLPDLTSSVDPTKQGRRKKRLAAAGFGVTLGCATLLGLFLSRGGAIETSVSASSVSAPVESSAPSALPPEVVPAVTSAAPTEPMPSASASAGKKPTKTPPRTSKPVDTSLLREFSERKKK